MELFIFIISALLGCGLAIYCFNKNESKAS